MSDFESDKKDVGRYQCPIAGANQSFTSFMEDLSDWKQQCSLDKKQLGPHVKLRGFSNNRNFQNWGKLLDRTKLSADDGFEYLCEQMLLHSRESTDLMKVTRNTDWENFRRKPAESFAAFLPRWEISYIKAKTDALYPISEQQAAFKLLAALSFTEEQYRAISQKVKLDATLTVDALKDAVNTLLILPAQAVATAQPSAAHFAEPDGSNHSGARADLAGSDQHAPYPDSWYDGYDQPPHWDDEHGWLCFQGFCWDEETSMECSVFFSEHWQEDVMWDPELQCYLAQDQCRICFKRTNPPHWGKNCPEKGKLQGKSSGKASGKSHGKGHSGKGSYLTTSTSAQDGSNQPGTDDALFSNSGKSKGKSAGKGHSKGYGNRYGKGKSKGFSYAPRSTFRPYYNNRSYYSEPIQSAPENPDNAAANATENEYLGSWANYVVPQFTYMAVPVDASEAADDQSANGPDPVDEDFQPDWSEAAETAVVDASPAEEQALEQPKELSEVEQAERALISVLEARTAEEKALDGSIAAKAAARTEEAAYLASPEVQTQGKVPDTWQPSLRHQTDVSDVQPSLPQSTKLSLPSKYPPLKARSHKTTQTDTVGLPPLELLPPIAPAGVTGAPDGTIECVGPMSETPSAPAAENRFTPLPAVDRFKPDPALVEKWIYHAEAQSDLPDHHRQPRYRRVGAFHARNVVLPNSTFIAKVERIIEEAVRRGGLDVIVLMGLCPEQCTPGQARADSLCTVLQDKFLNFSCHSGDDCIVMTHFSWQPDPDHPPVVVTNKDHVGLATLFSFQQNLEKLIRPKPQKATPATFRFAVGTMTQSDDHTVEHKMLEHNTHVWLGDLDGDSGQDPRPSIQHHHPTFQSFGATFDIGLATLRNHLFSDVNAETSYSAIFPIEQQRGTTGAKKRNHHPEQPADRPPKHTSQSDSHGGGYASSAWLKPRQQRHGPPAPRVPSAQGSRGTAGTDELAHAYPLYNALLSVPLNPGEVVYDPGCTAETGSQEAWEGLNLAMQERYGEGFFTEASQAKFCVADGNIATAKKSYSAAFEIPGKGVFKLAGSALPCGDDPKRHTPILFSNPTCEALGLVMDHTNGDLYSKRLGVTVRCRKTTTGHWALPIFDLLDRANAKLSKNA